MAINDWLKKKRGQGRSSFLKSWKADKTIRVWLHTADEAQPCDVYRHNIPTLVTIKGRNGEEDKVRIFTKNYVCHETEETLEGQYWRVKEQDATDERPLGSREHPIERCGLCKLVEWSREQALLARATKGKQGIGWTTKAFKFEGVDDKGRPETKYLHIGGIPNLFGAKDLSDEQKAGLKKAGIFVGGDDGAWAENMYAKQQTVFCIVDDAKPENGVQVAVETGLLGEKVKEVINKELKRRGPQKGNPQTHPYCIEWEYKKAEAQFNKKYDATALDEVKATPQILKLIRGEAPDTTDAKKPFNQQAVRAMLERHCVLEKGVVPWDELFPTKEQEETWREEDAATKVEDEKLRAEINADGTPEEPADREDVEGNDPAHDHEIADPDEEVECNQCAKVIKMSDAKCPHCGKEYQVEAAPPPAAPRVLKKRGDPAVAPPPPAPSSKSGAADDGLNDDEIPF